MEDPAAGNPARLARAKFERFTPVHPPENRSRGGLLYVISNALKNVLRNKGRNILLFVSILVIIVTCGIALMIQNASTSIINDYKSRFGTQVYLTPDFQKLASTGAAYPTISQEQQKQIAKSSSLKEWAATATDQLAPLSGVKAVDADAKEAQEKDGKSFSTTSGGDGSSARTRPSAKLVAATDLPKEEKFRKGERSLLEGTAPKVDGEALISKEFAELNKLKVGDSFKSDSSFDATEGAKTITYELKVVGIYADTASAYPSGFPMNIKEPILNNRNEIYTTYNTVHQQYSAPGAIIPELHMTYVLKSPEALDTFRKDVQAAGVDVNKWSFKTDLESYNNIVKPVDNMRNLATVFLIVVLILGGGILVLISMIAVRERKYEIGVLRAMGMPKRKVLTGFLTESVALTFAALLIALPLTFVAAKPIADGLLHSQNDAYANSAEAASQPNTGKPSGGFIIGATDGIVDTAPKKNTGGLTSLDVPLGPDSILQLGLLSTVLAALASVIGIVNISRFEPIKILSDRN
ncbi:ABC transporter permease [Arthrobacter sp. MMS24-S77]